MPLLEPVTKATRPEWGRETLIAVIVFVSAVCGRKQKARGTVKLFLLQGNTIKSRLAKQIGHIALQAIGMREKLRLEVQRRTQILIVDDILNVYQDLEDRKSGVGGKEG